MALSSSGLTRSSSAGSRRGFRDAGLASIIALALAAGGCGDDEDKAESGAVDTATAPSTQTGARTDPARTGTSTESTDTGAGSTATTPTSPEDQPGGAGDEVPASSQAMLTGKGGAIKPSRVQVPPFIAIRVELRSADGARYSLRFGKRTISAGGSIGSASHLFGGLKTGERLVGSGPSGRVVIEASADPGP